MQLLRYVIVKNVIKFVIFLFFTILIFIINDFCILGIVFCANIIIARLLKIELKGIFYNIKLLLPFILFTVILNVIFDSLVFGILIGMRIIICYNITYIFSKTITIFELSEIIQKLCYPLKLFKVNTKNIGIMVAVSLCMVPILKNEFFTLTQSMKSKGKPMKLSSIIIIMKPMLISVLKKTSQMEKALMAKAYME